MNAANTTPALHRIRCRSEHFVRYMRGERHFEIRNDDRRYNHGDVLEMQEFEPCALCDGRGRTAMVGAQADRCACLSSPHRLGRYTGRSLRVIVTHVVVLNSVQQGPNLLRVVGVTQPEARFSDAQVRDWCLEFGIACADLERTRQAMLAAHGLWPAQVKITTNFQDHE